MAVSQIPAAGISSVSATTVSSGTLPKAQLPTGSVLQVVNSLSVSFSTFSTSSTSFTASGFTASITPISATSKILIFVSGTNQYNLTAGGENIITLYRQIGSGSYANAVTDFLQISGAYGSSASFRASLAITFLDSPATTSQCNYQIYAKTNGAGTCSISQPNLGFTLMEIAA